MEKIKEIRTDDIDYNAFDLMMKCKELSKQIDLSNVILDNMSIDEKEIIITIIESIRNLEFEIIEEPYLIPKAKA
jgi:hypothetical protein|tara:strand:- start:303 stop:527 length:225 start_codon:yes stop_codon:yes gene_type:complete